MAYNSHNFSHEGQTHDFDKNFKDLSFQILQLQAQIQIKELEAPVEPHSSHFEVAKDQELKSKLQENIELLINGKVSSVIQTLTNKEGIKCMVLQYSKKEVTEKLVGPNVCEKVYKKVFKDLGFLGCNKKGFNLLTIYYSEANAALNM